MVGCAQPVPWQPLAVHPDAVMSGAGPCIGSGQPSWSAASDSAPPLIPGGAETRRYVCPFWTMSPNTFKSRQPLRPHGGAGLFLHVHLSGAPLAGGCICIV